MGCGCGQTSGNGAYQLITPAGTVLTDDAGMAVVFATRAEAEAARARHGGTIVTATDATR